MKPKRLYCETNWILELVFVQSPDAEGLREYARDHPSAVAVPEFSLAEAVVSFHRSEADRKQLSATLTAQRAQALRSGVRNARELVRYLSEARNANDGLIDDLSSRLSALLPGIAAELDVVPLDGTILRMASGLSTELGLSRMDSLVLASILTDAAAQEAGVALGFLSGNTRDFGQSGVVQILRRTGITYFARTDAALGWLRSTY